jgi:DNA-binding MltR family transcriptional regulator
MGSQPTAYSKVFKAFKKLTRSSPNVRDHAMMEAEFFGESDRAVIILAATLDDYAIEIALRQVLRKDESTDDLFEQGPLGSFSAKIKIGFALNLFDKVTKHDLNIIREVRNGFAHDRRPLTFATPEVADMCKHLKLPDYKSVAIPTGYLKVAKDKSAAKDMKNPKTRYIVACFTISHFLMAPRGSVPQLP